MILHAGYNTKERWVKFTDCIDVLPCDATHVRQVELEDGIDLYNRMHILENNGWHVIIDTDELRYETAT